MAAPWAAVADLATASDAAFHEIVTPVSLMVRLSYTATLGSYYNASEANATVPGWTRVLSHTANPPAGMRALLFVQPETRRAVVAYRGTDLNRTNESGQADACADLLLDGRGLKLQGNEGGYFIGPSLFDNVKPGMETYHEEIFGPVLSVMTFRTPEEAIQRANDTPFGLSAGIWTDKGSKVFEIASKMKAGVVWCNTFNKFDAASPFGGFKKSGIGRELGPEGFGPFTEIQSVLLPT